MQALNDTTTNYEIFYHLTVDSKNGKTGCPTSTSSANTCWTECAQYDNCYAKGGPLAIHWRKVSSGERGTDLAGFCAKIKALPRGQVWRHNQAGDLPGVNERIDMPSLKQLVAANRGRKGFTYCHKPMDIESNRRAVCYANKNGFTVNLSADNPAMADHLAELNIGPVVTVLPSNQLKNSKTPAGRTIVVCPADHVTKRDRGINCGTCTLCQWPERKVIIGFPAHGTKKKAIDKTFVSLEALTA